MELKICPAGSVGIIFKKQGKYLMFRRLKKPQGWAGIAGHLDGDAPLDAAIKESKEEIGLDLQSEKLKFLFQEKIYPNPCRRGDYDSHEWTVYEYEFAAGENPKIIEPENHADLGFFTAEEIKEKFAKEPHDPAWRKIFSKTGVI
ncbi:MAG: NUDIX hydrolase [Candidatus Niyogibacteria bacterium]|nr:NUDIX hydrolase [Candidatus Niyogibacteria bacterium]